MSHINAPKLPLLVSKQAAVGTTLQVINVNMIIVLHNMISTAFHSPIHLHVTETCRPCRSLVKGNLP